MSSVAPGPWRAGNGRVPRGALVLMMAAALHVGAALLFTRGAGPRSGASLRDVPAVALVWLAPAGPAPAAVEPPPAPTPPQTSKAVARSAPPASIAPREVPDKAALVDERDVAVANPADPPALLVAPPPAEPVYATARRSLVFGGRDTPRADTPTPAPANGARPLAAWVVEGVARSVWPVANALATAGDGTCRTDRTERALLCDGEALAARVRELPAPAQRALLTWIESGLAAEIEIRVEGGAAHYAVR